jgi:hypothetical protein
MTLQYNLLLATRGASPFLLQGGKFTPLLFWSHEDPDGFLLALEDKLLKTALVGGETLHGAALIRYANRPDVEKLNGTVCIHRVGVCSEEEIGYYRAMPVYPQYIVRWTNPVSGEPPLPWEGPSYDCVDYNKNVTFFHPTSAIPLAIFAEELYNARDNE